MSESFSYAAFTSARESRSKTQAEVAEAAGVSQGVISRIENGLRAPSEDQIERIARYLEYPPQLFFEQGPIKGGKSPCPYHRKRKTLPASVLDRLDGEMAIRLINVRHLFHGLELAADRQFHTLDPEEFGGPEAVAQTLRRAWGVPIGPIRELVALLESAGAVIIMSPFGSHKLFGMSQWVGSDHPLFFLNEESPMEELRWTLAHELGHLVMHGFPTSGDLEEEADAFAGEFLAPRHQIAPELRRLEFAKLPALKMRWRVSMKAIIKRAEVLGSIDRDSAVRLYKRYSALRWNAVEPYPLPAETPTLIREAARVHFEQHGYSTAELAEAVRLTANELERALLNRRRPAGNRPLLSVVEHRTGRAQ